MSGVFIKGALIELEQALLVPAPNVVVFQFNPETIEHTFQHLDDSETAGGAAPRAHPLGASGNPTERFSFTLVMDAADTIASHEPVSGSIAAAMGVAPRVAALEMLMFPVKARGAELLGSAPALAKTGAATAVPSSELPTVLFVWGPGRVVPVRVSSLAVREMLYDGALNPTHAEASIDLEVIRPEDFGVVSGAAARMASGAYAYTHTRRQALAITNRANALGSVIGAIPL